jgi:hypothetical protein
MNLSHLQTNVCTYHRKVLQILAPRTSAKRRRESDAVSPAESSSSSSVSLSSSSSSFTSSSSSLLASASTVSDAAVLLGKRPRSALDLDDDSRTLDSSLLCVAPKRLKSNEEGQAQSPAASSFPTEHHFFLSTRALAQLLNFQRQLFLALKQNYDANIAATTPSLALPTKVGNETHSPWLDVASSPESLPLSLWSTPFACCSLLVLYAQQALNCTSQCISRLITQLLQTASCASAASSASSSSTATIEATFLFLRGITLPVITAVYSNSALTPEASHLSNQKSLVFHSLIHCLCLYRSHLPTTSQLRSPRQPL